MRDLCVDAINKFFGLLGLFEVLWRLVWEVVWPPTDLKRVEGQTVLLTGINPWSLGLAKRLAARGAHLVFWDENAEQLEEVAQEFEAHDVEITTQTVNLTEHREVQKAIRLLADQHTLQVDILINAAGVGPQVDWLEETDEHVEKIMDSNFKSAVWATRAVLPDFFKRRSGHIVTIGSTSGVTPTPHICEYSACQAGLVAFMKAIEVDALARGLPEIQFTSLSPTFVQSDFIKDGKFSGKILWDRMEIEDTCDSMLVAVLSDRRSLIVPWQDLLLSSLQMILPQVRYHKLLARRWLYGPSKCC